MLIWMRGEPRDNEARAPMTPEGAAALIAQGARIIVEDSLTRIIPPEAYRDVGCEIAPDQSWINAPREALILGLKELPDDETPLSHRHIMFGHAYKGQSSGRRLLDRFKAGGGTLLDLEYLVDTDGRRVAAFGYWAGFAGAAVTVMAWASQRADASLGPVAAVPSELNLRDAVSSHLDGRMPRVIIIGAKGRVGTGAADLCRRVGLSPTLWDMKETSHGGPFPEILAHDIFLNCILAQPGVPVFVPKDSVSRPRTLSAIGDIACDPDSDYNPVPVYSKATTWADPVVRVADEPILDVMAIDNLPSLMPRESTEDFAAQLLPHLLELDTDQTGVWERAEATFREHV
ncbi:MAG: saccharopine dehydrogenase [Pseudomonadota bacterium]